MDQIDNIKTGILNHDFSNAIFIWEAIVFPICVALIYGIIYSLNKTNAIYAKRRKELLRGSKEADVFSTPESRNKNIQEWVLIAAKSRLPDENERKFAIIAADALIERILDLAGYHGENLGDRLKKIESSDLDSLNDLWEAHKVRNRIAHEAGYKLSPEDSARVIACFEKALKELSYI
ncbi:hypothetical protein A2662_00550 [Candidatus Giovannonibacteria bacterium RIFCSPHIGHO2_01_FULL_45_33]|uniref:DUF4145 domain-containing protein n=1 Tax=Candidatus Giovannonibacteria bacterium RIFCSPLOWO2_01_FULL_45_34 TaxID=1798351 RepID=A0A1F5WZN0_9BACT|nr:MAG: hypothetical protein A2662_00550 [Candidatus Giovannonibacteria bacterium RIFCSPHIGHO2_01_FULL_45_33]OGF69798.1 MAG: hypothetical protein A3C73_03415 [Candidatus Giovannonibacteria bacterium RIFCSPHIGHO2_02_FULL_44_11]OGF80771.1 MAG: hypothetical protein A2930_02485 [Candidatus Giovannonibacteria bacterium RIFCSPLOWO2_01_FULL_45_34]